MERSGAADTAVAWAHGGVSNGRRLQAGVFAPIVLFLGLLTVSAWADEYFQYLPSTLQSETTPTREDAVLVKKITIVPGDTLSKLSRHYSGTGRYYPQILLFNKISDPNRIFAGRSLLVPVSLPVSRRKSGHAAPEVSRGSNQPDTVRVPSASHSSENEKRPSHAEERLYKKAVVLLDQGECRKAIRSFSLFLKKYPDSMLAPYARLRRADCYLSLSAPQDSEPAYH
jgi:LysM repeat protein